MLLLRGGFILAFLQVGKVTKDGYKFVMSYGMVTAENYPNGTLLAA